MAPIDEWAQICNLKEYCHLPTFFSNSFVLLRASFCIPCRLRFLSCSALFLCNFCLALSSSDLCLRSSICFRSCSLNGNRFGMPGSFFSSIIYVHSFDNSKQYRRELMFKLTLGISLCLCFLSHLSIVFSNLPRNLKLLSRRHSPTLSPRTNHSDASSAPT